MGIERTGLEPPELFLLWAARETGIVAALTDDADTPAEVAAAADVTERAATLAVEALAELGFLTRVGEAYEPTDRMLGFLAAADLRSVGVLPDALDTADALVALPETLRTGEPPAGGDPRHRLGARAATDDATVRAVVTAAVRAAPDAERVLDVRGSPGIYAREFASRGCAITLADRPAALDPARPLLAGEPVDLVAVEAGDPLPGDFELVVAVDAVRRLDPGDVGAFVARLADALAPGGTLAVVDVLDRSERAVPAAIEAFARDGGGVYGEADYAGWFADAGLDGPAVGDVPGTDRQMVVGRHETRA